MMSLCLGVPGTWSAWLHRSKFAATHGDGQMLLKMDCGRELAQQFRVNLRRRAASHTGGRDVTGKCGNGSRQTD